MNNETTPAALPVEALAPSDEQIGWLIEHSGAMPGIEAGIVSWLFVQPKFKGFGAYELGFTHDASKALRFSRKVDAEEVLKMHLGLYPPDWYSKPFSVTEHMWPAAPSGVTKQPADGGAEWRTLFRQWMERVQRGSIMDGLNDFYQAAVALHDKQVTQ